MQDNKTMADTPLAMQEQISVLPVNAGDALVSTRDLTKRFGQKHILKGIDLDIKKGDRIVIVGPSGSGKSTFLRTLNLLEPPTSGSIFFEGEEIFNVSSILTRDKMEILKAERKDLQKQDPMRSVLTDSIAFLKKQEKHERIPERALELIMDKKINLHRQKIGMVFQQFNLFNHLNVLDNITIAPIRLKRMTKQEAVAKAGEYLERIGLSDKMAAFPSQLSGGQKQRIAIVRSLVMNPDVMLFDEPTSALDPEMVGEVLDFIKQLARDGMTMAIVTHEMNFAREIATEILFMDEGRILEKNTPKEFFSSPSSPRLQEFLSKVLRN